jgi:8-oxo-dGTP diphosphatase
MNHPVITEWSGRSARRLQEALRLTNEEFAEHLGCAVRTVACWRANPGIVPRREVQRALDTAYKLAGDDARDRFAALTGPPPQTAAQSVVAAAEQALLQARLDEVERKLAVLGIRL